MKYITHYTKLDILLNKILDKNEFLLGSLSNMNDPYESKKRQSFIWTTKKLEYNKIVEGIRFIDDVRENKIKVGCFVKEDNDDLRELKNFSSIKSSPLWAHYGENHKGVAIIFDKEMLIQACNNVVNHDWAAKYELVNYLDNLYYSGNAPDTLACDINTDFNESSISKYLFEKAKDFWFKKDSRWSYEEEYRIMIFNEDENNTLINISNCIKAIVFGDQVSNFAVKLISSKCKDDRIICAKIKFDVSKSQYICKIL